LARTNKRVFFFIASPLWMRFAVMVNQPGPDGKRFSCGR
jgi:hypothetical protein